MTKIKIGGVPEHFNLPWHYALENKSFQAKGIDLEWVDYPGGTGAMNKALRAGELDAAVILTEGIVADIVNGNESKIVQWYVNSPLIWGIHVAADSSIQNDKNLEGKKYAISRYGSGSHLMAYVDAHQRGNKISAEQFVVINTIEGAVKALQNKEADLFMWEKLMTKPYVDKGIFRRVGECPTPWPSFVIAVREAYLRDNPTVIASMLNIIQESCKTFYALPDAQERIVKKFSLLPEDVKVWMSTIQWQTNESFETTVLGEVMETLLSLSIIDKRKTVAELCYKPALRSRL